MTVKKPGPHGEPWTWGDGGGDWGGIYSKAQGGVSGGMHGFKYASHAVACVNACWEAGIERPEGLKLVVKMLRWIRGEKTNLDDPQSVWAGHALKELGVKDDGEDR